MPLVSVVMSFHNARDTLASAVKSILWQSYTHWELILLNDGSTDESGEIAKIFDDSRIHFMSDSVCRGLPARLNQGVSLARGEYIARMDADDIAFPDRFARQVAYLQDHPDVDLLATAALLITKNNKPMGILKTEMSHEVLCRKSWQGFPMPHPTWMGRADWFQANPYDERARKCEDQALLYRSYRTSRFAGLPDVLLGYRYEGLSVRKTLLGRYHYLRVVAVYGDAIQMLRGLLGHVLAATRDLGGILLGLEAQVIKTRVQSIDSEIIAQWQDLLEHLSHPIEKKKDR
ncbi:MAG: glycosyltransferase family 2 protein [Methylococcales bacterium]